MLCNGKFSWKDIVNMQEAQPVMHNRLQDKCNNSTCQRPVQSPLYCIDMVCHFKSPLTSTPQLRFSVGTCCLRPRAKECCSLVCPRTCTASVGAVADTHWMHCWKCWSGTSTCSWVASVQQSGMMDMHGYQQMQRDNNIQANRWGSMQSSWLLGGLALVLADLQLSSSQCTDDVLEMQGNQQWRLCLLQLW